MQQRQKTDFSDRDVILLDKNMAVLEERFDNLGRKLDEISKVLDTLQEKYVSRTEFTPVKNIVYGIVGTILTAIISGMVMFYINSAK